MIKKLVCLLLCSLALCNASYAQSNDETRYYDVEIIIFKNLRVPKSREVILPVNSPLKDKEMMNIFSTKSLKKAEKKSYQLLNRKHFQLVKEATKLEKSSYYQVLLHTAWRQPGVELGKAMPIWLRAGKRFGAEFLSIDTQNTLLPENTTSTLGDTSVNSAYEPLYEVEGKITIALSRYLHTYTDLVFRRPRLSLDDTLENTESADPALSQSPDTRILLNHSLKEHRRMRSKTLHFLDNPEFGLLIKITPYDKSAESATAS